jgi:hypothetical protein
MCSHAPAQSQWTRHCPSTLWGMALGCSGTSHTAMHACMCFTTVLLFPSGTAPCMQWPGAPYIAVPSTPSTLPWLHAPYPCPAVPAGSRAVHAVTLGCMTCSTFSRSMMQGPALSLRSWWPTRHWEHSAWHHCSLTRSVGEQLCVGSQCTLALSVHGNASQVAHGMVGQGHDGGACRDTLRAKNGAHGCCAA